MNKYYKENQILNRLYERNYTVENLKQFGIMDVLDNVSLKFKDLKGAKSAYKNNTIFLDKSFLDAENINMNEIERHLLHQLVRFEQDINVKDNSDGMIGLDELVNGDKFFNFIFLALSEVDAYIKEKFFWASEEDIAKANKTKRPNDLTVVFLKKLEEYFALSNNKYDLSKFSFSGNTAFRSHEEMIKDNANAILRSFSNYEDIGKLFTYKVNLDEILKAISLHYQQNGLYKLAVDNYIGEGRVTSMNAFISILKGKGR